MKKSNKDRTYIWISAILAAFFWTPLLNNIMLPLSMMFSIKSMLNSRKDPAGFWIAFALLVFAIISFAYSTVVNIYFRQG